MDFEFFGDLKVIRIGTGVTSFEVADLYSRYKDWVLDGNAQWAQAMRPIGGQSIGGGQVISPYIELINGWKIKPYEGDHILTVIGNIITDDETSPFKLTDGEFNVSIRSIVTSNSITTIGGGTGTPNYTLQEIAQEVWDHNIDTHDTPNSVGNFIKTKLLRFREWFELKDKQ